MVERKEELEKYIRSKLNEFAILGKEYDDERLNKLVDNLSNSNKSIDELKKEIDSKFSYHFQKISHNDYLTSLKKYYLSNVEKYKKGNNCYLLSYYHGDKVLEQACIEDLKKTDNKLPLYKINKKSIAFRKKDNENSYYELIISDIAYLLGINYAKTYIIFDNKMNANGVLNECYNQKDEKYLNMEDALQFIKEESSKFTLKEKLIEFHDKHLKKDVVSTIKENIDYVFHLFEALPDIRKPNVEKLKKDFLKLKLFDLIVNSVNNDLRNIGIIVNKKNMKYTYELSFMYNKYEFKNDKLEDNEIIFNFMKTTKDELIDFIIKDYYDYVKEFSYLINNNRETLVPLIEQIIKEHLEYDDALKYINMVKDNINKISFTFELYKMIDDGDNELFMNINESYENRISPFIDNYKTEENEKGGTVFLSVAAIVLVGTIILIGIAIVMISRTNL